MKKVFIHVQMVVAATLTLTTMLCGTSLHDQRQIAQRIIAPQLPQLQSIIDKNALSELGISSDLQACFGVPKTIFGETAQEYLVTHPIDDMMLLQERAKVISALKNSPELQAALLEQFDAIAQNQEVFFSYWENENEVVSHARNKVYFGKKLENLNQNALALELNRGATILSKIPSFLPLDFYLIGGTLLASYIIGRIKDDALLPVSNFWAIPGKAVKDTFRVIVREHNPLRKITLGDNSDCITPTAEGLAPEPTLGDLIYNFSHPEQSMEKLANIYQSAGLQDAVDMVKNYGSKFVKATIGISVCKRLYYDVMWGRGSKVSAELLNDRKHTVEELHAKIRSVAKLYKAVDAIHALIRSEPELASFEGFKSIHALCANAQSLSKGMEELVTLLKTDSLLGSSSMIVFQGRILAAHKLMEMEKDLFGAALHALGELEAYLEVARMMNTQRTCFVEFTENGRGDNSEIYVVNPLINVVNAYNPVVKNNVFSQDITIGGQSAVRNMLITGPNGCGKSTVLKNLAYTIVSAQVFNIAFADSCLMTPFARILNYSKIEDNLKEEMSTFMAEAKRIEDIKHEVANTSGRVAVFVDEALKGTLTETGATMLYDFCKEMISFQHCFLADATHFEYPTELEAVTNGAILNFHLEPKELAFGEFEPVYTIHRGKALWWFEDAAKRESYIAWLNKRINA